MVTALLVLSACVIAAYLLTAVALTPSQHGKGILRSMLFGLGWPHLVYGMLKRRLR